MILSTVFNTPHGPAIGAGRHKDSHSPSVNYPPSCLCYLFQGAISSLFSVSECLWNRGLLTGIALGTGGGSSTNDRAVQPQLGYQVTTTAVQRQLALTPRPHFHLVQILGTGGVGTPGFCS